MRMRCKMRCQSVEPLHEGSPTSRVTFTAQYDPECPEDQRFEQATPSGEISLNVSNPRVLGGLKVGDAYYVDFVHAAQ